jgi:hypothetical protein
VDDARFRLAWQIASSLKNDRKTPAPYVIAVTHRESA